jgi:hypothetical protein
LDHWKTVKIMRKIREIREREEMKGIGEEMTAIREEMTGIRSHIGQYGTRIQIMVGILQGILQGILPRNLAEDLAGILIGCNSNHLVILEAAARIQDIIVMATTTAMITTSK